MFFPLIRFESQAIHTFASKLIIALALALPLDLAADSGYLPGSCYDPDFDQCTDIDDNSMTTCSCGQLCLQTLAGTLEANVCCEDFQEKWDWKERMEWGCRIRWSKSIYLSREIENEQHGKWNYRWKIIHFQPNDSQRRHQWLNCLDRSLSFYKTRPYFGNQRDRFFLFLSHARD